MSGVVFFLKKSLKTFVTPQMFYKFAILFRRGSVEISEGKSLKFF